VIGIVVVSHSRALATAAVGLAAEMVAEADRPVIAVAAGWTRPPRHRCGGRGEAIGAADSPDGVLVLVDLGSAVLSAEMALEFVDPEVADRVVVSSAPLVEGLVAAVVLASTGAPIDAVVSEAKQGLAAKQDHLGDASTETAVPAVVAPESAQTVEVVVDSPHGLHARPAAKLVALVRSYDAVVTLTDLDTGRGPVDAGSLSMVATLNAQQGHRLRVGATGPQATDALAAVRQLADQSFGDQPAPTKPSPASTAAGRSGSGLDVAMGRAIVAAAKVDLSDYHAGDAAAELRRSEVARTRATTDLEVLRPGPLNGSGRPRRRSSTHTWRCWTIRQC